MLLLAAFVMIEYGYYAGVRDSIYTHYPKNDRGTEGTLEEGETLCFSFSTGANVLRGLDLYISSPYDAELELQLTVKEAAADTTLFSEILTADDLLSVRSDGSWSAWFTTPVSGSGETLLAAELTCLQAGRPLVLTMSTDGKTPYISTIYEARVRLRQLYLYFWILPLIAGIVLVWYGICADWRIQRLFPAALLPAVLSFSFFVKPLSVPDEYAHFDAAYDMASTMLGDPGSSIPDSMHRRTCDLITDPAAKTGLSAESFTWFYAGPVRVTEKAEIPVPVYARDMRDDSAAIFYLPAAAGIAAARLFHAGFAVTALLARLSTLLSAAGLLYLAIRITPVGKAVFAAAALLPASLQQLGSFSVDAMIIPVCFLLTACCLRILFQKERTSFTQLSVVLLLSALLAFAKGGAYLPLALLVIPVLWQYLQKNAGLSRGKAAAVLTVIAVLLAAAVLVKFHSVYASKLFGHTGITYSSRRRQYSYTILYVLTHPGSFFRLLEGTVQISLPDYVSGLLGNSIGWLYAVSVHPIVQYGYLILLTLVFLNTEKNEPALSSSQRGIGLTACVLCSLMIVLAMLTGWTPLGAATVHGVQGRYFLPFLPLLLLCLQGRRFRLLQDRGRLLIRLSALLSLPAVVSLAIGALG